MSAPPPAAAPSAVRGACPSLVAPMPTGDGLIARLLPADGVLTTAALAALCDAARSFGNGIVEVTQRGSLQLRGVRADTAEALEAAAHSVGAAPPPGPPVHVGPLAGLEPAEVADPRPLAAALRARLAATAEALPPKVAIVVDGGGAWPLDGLSADLRLTAVATGEGPMWRLSTDFEAVSPPLAAAAAVDAVVAAASTIGRSDRRRPTPRVPHPPVGVLLAPQIAGDRPRSKAISGIAFPYGFTHADRLAMLVAAAEHRGADEVRLAPGHGIVFVGCSNGFDPAAFLSDADRLGFVTHPDDPRLALAVCAGAPACGSGEAPTRPLADAVVAAAAPLIAARGSIHLSGCTKGCARAAPADLTIVGREGGYALVDGGTAGDAAGELVDAQELLAAVTAASRRLAAAPRTRDSGAPPNRVRRT